MTEQTPTPLTAPAGLSMLGTPDAAFCEGDVCIIPEHPEHAIVARRLDDDRV